MAAVWLQEGNAPVQACNSAGDKAVLAAVSRRAAHLAIRAYQVTLSSIAGRQCRHLPTCSDFADEAIRVHGLWAGGWMGLARIMRCRPGGTQGFDPVPEKRPPRARWYLPWRYGRWRGRNGKLSGW